MIIFDTFKFSCEKCISGHRSTSCNHINRDLKELKTKGRPRTQCSHCQKSRISPKSAHNTCLCGDPIELSKRRYKFYFEETSLTFTATPIESTKIISRIELNNQELVLTIETKTTTIKQTVKFIKSEMMEQSLSLKEYERMIVNPCNCHLGEPCICSKLPTKPTIKQHGELGKGFDELFGNGPDLMSIDYSSLFDPMVTNPAITNMAPVTELSNTVSDGISLLNIINPIQSITQSTIQSNLKKPSCCSTNLNSSCNCSCSNPNASSCRCSNPSNEPIQSCCSNQSVELVLKSCCSNQSVEPALKSCCSTQTNQTIESCCSKPSTKTNDNCECGCGDINNGCDGCEKDLCYEGLVQYMHSE